MERYRKRRGNIHCIPQGSDRPSPSIGVPVFCSIDMGKVSVIKKKEA